MKKVIWFGLLAVVFSFALSFPAEAKERKRSGSYSNSEGKSGTFERTVSRDGQGNVSKSRTSTNQDGKTATRSKERTWDKETKTGTYNSSSTGPHGAQRSASGTITKTDTGFTSTGTRVNAKGETSSVNRTVTKNEDGTVLVNKVVTNAAGESRTMDKTITKTEDGRSVTGSYSSTDGKSGTFQKDVSRADGVKTVSSSVTNQDGQTATHQATVTHADGTITRNVTNAGFDGQTVTKTQTATVGPVVTTETPAV